MPSLRELKKRLRSIRTTGQLAGAMRTVSTAKYSKVNAMSSGYGEYAGALTAMLADVRRCDSAFEDVKKRRSDDRDDFPLTDALPGKRLYVLLSGNRGLCGGYNHELFAYFENELAGCVGPHMIVAAGRMAAEFCREKGYAVHTEFAVSDVPTYEEAERLSCLLCGLYDSGEAESVDFVYQRFINMMRHEPATHAFLPVGGSGEDGGRARAQRGLPPRHGRGVRRAVQRRG